MTKSNAEYLKEKGIKVGDILVGDKYNFDSYCQQLKITAIGENLILAKIRTVSILTLTHSKWSNELVYDFPISNHGFKPNNLETTPMIEIGVTN